MIVFLWNLRDSKSPQISWTLLNILAVLNNVVIWMVSTRPPTSKSSSLFSNPLVTVPNAPIIIGLIVTFRFHIIIIIINDNNNIIIIICVYIYIYDRKYLQKWPLS